MKQVKNEKNMKQNVQKPKLKVLFRTIGYPTIPPHFERGYFDEQVKTGSFDYSNEQKGALASNKQLDRALLDGEEWRNIIEALPCFSGTMVAYLEPGSKFGETVEWYDRRSQTNWIFPVPKEYRGMRDSILVAESPNFHTGCSMECRTVKADHVDVIENFPKEDGWYLADDKYKIPFGETVEGCYPFANSYTHPDARYLVRYNRSIITLLVRGSLEGHKYQDDKLGGIGIEITRRLRGFRYIGDEIFKRIIIADTRLYSYVRRGLVGAFYESGNAGGLETPEKGEKI